ncbi:ribose transport system permease protein [Anaerosolibacter carboniphilus]|uniref:Ribose transport system permease protein n=1 Tax=Anaerosolibacter carboniphilus TaxID=1417629 RepID=A0A841KVQ9_9FIRM|nr:ABC transporter permease [Anaerosolibacter carboniphilus]MBB6217521.1 ribose transport system permease protein [Anaerosolibacter carboniphilus]
MNTGATLKKESISKFKNFYAEYTYLFSFIVLIIIATMVNNKFLTYSNLSTLMLQASIKGIIALGMTLIIISGQIDLSVGSTCALVAGLGVVVLNNTQNAFVMLLFCMVFGTLLGLVNGLLVTKGKIAAFIVTLATMSAYRSIIVQLGQGGPFNVSYELVDKFRMIAAGGILGIPNLALIFIVITAVIAFMMSNTKFGRYVYAVGSNENAAKLTGINVDQIKILCFSVTGFLTGISAFLLSSRLTSITAPNAGASFELDAIAAVAIGGTAMNGGRGKVVGTFLGAIMLQMIEGILIAAKIPPFLTGLVKGIIIILAVLFQSRKEK